MIYVFAVVVGAILGFLNARVLLVGSAMSLIPWAIAGLIVGWFAKSKKQSLVVGAIYGFFLSFVFMVAGYNGTRPLIQVIPFFIGLGIFGALCGLVLSFIGCSTRKLLKN